jgi:hypothetical protein
LTTGRLNGSSTAIASSTKSATRWVHDGKIDVSAW